MNGIDYRVYDYRVGVLQLE